MSTRAISFLKKKKISYEVVKYEHREKGAEFAASATGYPLEHTVKTLVVEMDHKNYCLTLLPGHRELDLKKLASLLGIKGTAMVECNEETIMLGENQSTYIPLGASHRLTNPGKIPLHMIEVQSGSYLGEDDIVRLQDNYGRTETNGSSTNAEKTGTGLAMLPSAMPASSTAAT